MIFDSHTHNPDATNALIAVEPGFSPAPGHCYSIGIHPWHASQATAQTLQLLTAQAQLPQVKAIGETGLDRNTPNPKLQLQLLNRHIDLSEQLRLPLLLHIVRRYNEIIQLRKQIRPTQPWIIHGYRGNPQQTQQLLNHGFFLSLGQHYNPDSAAIIPADRLLLETDTANYSLNQLAQSLPQYDNTLPARLFNLNPRQ